MGRRLNWEALRRGLARAQETLVLGDGSAWIWNVKAGRLNYEEIARHGWPIGSGAVESACRAKQFRFKRPGQFWTPEGLRHLCALDEARRNGHWKELWTTA